MQLITLPEQAWQQLACDIADIRRRLLAQEEDHNFDSLWLNNHEVCQSLHISEKTLWRMRRKAEITYAKMYGQYYYKIGDIKKMLQSRAVESAEEYTQTLTEKARNIIRKGRKF
jgi:hypothetical protein